MKALVLWAAMALPAVADSLPQLHMVVGVAAGDVLNLRAAPDAGAPILGGLPPGTRNVEAVALSSDGKWARVNAGDTAGWVALRFLQRDAGRLDWWRLQSPMRCLGTEPFWTFDIGTSALKGLFVTPDPPPVRLAPRGIWPGSGAVPVAGVSMEGGGMTVQAVIEGRACSDGMSDRAYGLSAILLIGNGPMGGEAPLAGCCTLAP
jgi:uncharacterized membrane protein